MLHVLGSIRNRDGAGLSGVRVAVFGSGFGTESAYVTTDTTGVFELDLTEGKYSVYINPPRDLGLGDVTVDDVSVTRKSARIDYRYTGFQIQGTVLAPTGASVDSGFVSFYSARDDYRVLQRLQNGAFSVLVPRSGPYRMTAFSQDRSIPPALQTLDVTGDTTLVIQIEGIPVTGTLFGPDGAGIQGATIQAPGSGSYAESEAGGRYRLWVRDGGYRFLVSPPDGMTFILSRITRFLTVSGPTSLDVSLAGTRWSGFVRLATDSSVVPSAAVSAALVADYYNRSAVNVTGNDGAFQLILESGKEYDLSVKTPPPSQPLVIRDLVAVADSTFDIFIGPTR